MRTFRAFHLAVHFYHEAAALKLPRHLSDQLKRASSSVALNLAEGRGKPTRSDQLRFFHIAMGSVRECQAILILAKLSGSSQWNELDSLAASLYMLIKNAR